MRCFNCIGEVYMEETGDGFWRCPVCGDEYDEKYDDDYDDDYPLAFDLNGYAYDPSEPTSDFYDPPREV